MIVRDRNRPTIHRLLTALMVGGLIAMAVVILGSIATARTHATASQTAVETRTVVFEYEETPEGFWTALIASGFVGDPTDGCECLYVPVGTTVPGSGVDTRRLSTTLGADSQSTPPDTNAGPGSWSLESTDRLVFIPSA